MLRNIIKYVNLSKRYCHHNTPKELPLQCCKLAEQINTKLKKIDYINENIKDIKYNLDMSFLLHVTSWVSIILTFFS
jgi:hypothetical protein